MRTRVFPFFLKIQGRPVLVVGAGAAALPKIRALSEAGADIHVVALETSHEVKGMADRKEITVEERGFRDRDVSDAWFIVAATSDPAVNRNVRDAAEAKGVFCCAVDDPDNSSAFFGSVIDRPPFVVALSSSGEAPALTRLLREILEAILPGPEWIKKARMLRQRWKAEGYPIAQRFPDLVREVVAARQGPSAGAQEVPPGGEDSLSSVPKQWSPTS